MFEFNFTVLNNNSNLQIPPFKDVYLFVHKDVPHRSKRGAHEHTQKLNDHEKVIDNLKPDSTQSIFVILNLKKKTRLFGLNNKFTKCAQKET